MSTTNLYELGRKSAQNNEPGGYILNDDAAKVISNFSKGSPEWHSAVREFVDGFSSERLRMMGK